MEAFSAQAMINEGLHSMDALSKLEQLMNDVFIHRTDRIPLIPWATNHALFWRTFLLNYFPFLYTFFSPSTFRIPMRVTLNDAKRQAWFADLANPDVPLHKLGKSVPHGAKGHDLLDLLHSNNVAIPRAVWFLRVFGANETVSHFHTMSMHDWLSGCQGGFEKQANIHTDPIQRGLGKYGHWLHEKATGRNCPPERTKARAEYQTNIQRGAGGYRYSRSMDVTLYILVRWICFTKRCLLVNFCF